MTFACASQLIHETPLPTSSKMESKLPFHSLGKLLLLIIIILMGFLNSLYDVTST